MLRLGATPQDEWLPSFATKSSSSVLLKIKQAPSQLAANDSLIDVIHKNKNQDKMRRSGIHEMAEGYGPTSDSLTKYRFLLFIHFMVSCEFDSAFCLA